MVALPREHIPYRNPRPSAQPSRLPLLTNTRWSPSPCIYQRAQGFFLSGRGCASPGHSQPLSRALLRPNLAFRARQKHPGARHISRTRWGHEEGHELNPARGRLSTRKRSGRGVHRRRTALPPRRPKRQVLCPAVVSGVLAHTRPEGAERTKCLGELLNLGCALCTRGLVHHPVQLTSTRHSGVVLARPCHECISSVRAVLMRASAGA